MPRRSASQVAESRAAILAAAVASASLRGLEGLTVGRLAGELGMSKSGLIGPFGSKEQLQLATFDAAVRVFVDDVYSPAAREPEGRERLLALCDRWLSFLERDGFPGGCFLTTASVEFDGRPGPVRDAVAAATRRWLRALEREVAAAQKAGELPEATEPADIAFQLNALASGANNVFQLHGDRAVFARARRAMRRLLDA